MYYILGIFIRYTGRARHMVGIMSRATHIFWVYSTFEWIFERRISLTECNEIYFIIWRKCETKPQVFTCLQNLIFKDLLHKGTQKTAFNLPERSIKPNKPFDTCRVTLDKVAGNFHITAGKSIHFASGHIHISNLYNEVPLNFSHRINRFSFGDATSGIVHPLEGDEKILEESKTNKTKLQK